MIRDQDNPLQYQKSILRANDFRLCSSGPVPWSSKHQALVLKESNPKAQFK